MANQHFPLKGSIITKMGDRTGERVKEPRKEKEKKPGFGCWMGDDDIEIERSESYYFFHIHAFPLVSFPTTHYFTGTNHGWVGRVQKVEKRKRKRTWDNYCFKFCSCTHHRLSSFSIVHAPRAYLLQSNNEKVLISSDRIAAPSITLLEQFPIKYFPGERKTGWKDLQFLNKKEKKK